MAATSLPSPPTTEESIVKLISLITSSPDSPLSLVWKHAFEQGLQEGFKRGAAFFKDMDVKQAFCEGADQGQIVGILAEREEWEVEGHGQWCFDKPLTCLSCDVGLPEGHTLLPTSLTLWFRWIPSRLSHLLLMLLFRFRPHTTLPHPRPIHCLCLSMLKLKPSLQIQLPLLPLLLPWTPPAFNWSDDAASISIVPIFPKNQPCHNLSALHTTNPNPFSLLAH